MTEMEKSFNELRLMDILGKDLWDKYHEAIEKADAEDKKILIETKEAMLKGVTHDE